LQNRYTEDSESSNYDDGKNTCFSVIPAKAGMTRGFKQELNNHQRKENNL